MGDEEDGGPEAALRVLEQPEDLRLHGNVQRGGGLVRDEHGGAAGQRDGDHDPLAHPARKLEGVVAHPDRGLGDADLGQQFRRLFPCGAALQPFVEHEGFRDLVAHREHGVERGHRLLEDHGNVLAPDAPPLLLVHAHELAAPEPDAAAGNRARRGRDQPHDRQRGHALAAAGFAHDAEGFPGTQGKAEPIHGHGGLAADVEADLKAAHVKDGAGHSFLSLGLSAVVSPSPTRQMDSDVMKMMSPGRVAAHHASKM